MMGHIQEFQPGMAVYGSDLERIGRIEEMYPPIDWETTPDTSGDPIEDISPGEAVLTSLTGPGYLKVRQEEDDTSQGTPLYIPLSAVKSYAPGTSVVLLPDRAQAQAVYQTRPDILGPE
jgi:hypothetical protein